MEIFWLAEGFISVGIFAYLLFVLLIDGQKHLRTIAIVLFVAMIAALFV